MTPGTVPINKHPGILADGMPKEDRMINTRFTWAIIVLFSALLLLTLTACAPTPENVQIEAAIRASLAAEASPPDLVFADMEVPMRSAGKVGAMLWTEDETTQRNYELAYDRQTRCFVVSSYTTSQLSKDGSYVPIPNDLTLTFTEYASYFNFPSDFGNQYLLVYAGKGDSLDELRATFEAETSAKISAETLASFAMCDLGGDTLVLFVPRYEGMTVWINEIEHQGDLMISGAEVARFEDKPFYVYCDFDDKLPDYEIHMSLNGQKQFFTTREQLVESIKD